VNVSPERLRRFFVRTESGYQINRSVRDACIFSLHNIATDAPLSRMDLISCRNLLIYLQPALQRRVISKFGYALQPSGCLILGSSETLGDLAEYFHTLEEPYKIYCRKPNVPQTAFHLSDAGADYMPENSGFPVVPEHIEMPGQDSRVHNYVDQIVLSQYGPAGVVAEESLRIIEYRGDVAQYLAHTEMLGADLMTAVREELRAPLGAAIEQSRQTNLAVVAERIPKNGIGALNTITVVPLSTSSQGRHFLILFGQSREQAVLAGVPDAARGEPEGSTQAGTQQDTTPLSLEQENARLRHDLKSSRD
jgi:two-component system CheB/CheR fusion protein